MHSAIAPILRFLLRNAFQLVIVAVILVVGKAALDEWHKLPSARADLSALQSSMEDVHAFREKMIASTNARIERMRNAPIGMIDKRVDEVDAALAANRLSDQAPILTLPLNTLTRMPQRLADHFGRRVEIEILRQERDYLLRMHAYATKLLRIKSSAAKVEEMRLVHVGLYNAHLQALAQIAALKSDHRVLSHVPFTGHYAELLRREQAHADLVLKIRMANSAYRTELEAATRIGSAEAIPSFSVDGQRLDAILAPLQEALTEAKDVANGNWISRLLTPLIKVIPTAMNLLLFGFLGHLAIKAFLFYVLAPRVTRSAPLCLLPSVSGSLASGRGPASDLADASIKSAVSVEVKLAPREEMLILHEYVQSSLIAGNKDTKWLLDWSCPWTSLVSGMYALERIRSAGDEAIVVSSNNDPFCEIACISLPKGTAMVFQPRGLVGVIYDPASPLKITRHWRLLSLHAWLTLQLRFLVFSGPVTLIVKGNRGVRVERAGRGRTIRQGSTLGFSANVRYSAIRCETFFPFYAGKTALLQDRFENDTGYYVYDETPIGGRQSGKAERGLEGVLDATLKVFGI